MIELINDETKIALRLDIFVSSFMGVTRSRAQKLIEDGLVKVNGSIKDKNYKTRLNDCIDVTIQD